MLFTRPIPALVALLFLCQAALSSCSKKNEHLNGPHLPPPPVNEATSEETAKINETLTEIETLMAEMGHPKKFRAIPIYLTSDSHVSITDRPAACVSHGRHPQFMVLKRKVLVEESARDLGETEATLFKVLLHEIGHCYFGRQHEDNVIQKEGKRIELSFYDKKGRWVQTSTDSIDVSIMAPNRLVMPIPLKRYYVAEMLGLERAAEINDLTRHVEIQYYTPQTYRDRGR